MPKSEFTALEILANGKLSASGTTQSGPGGMLDTHLHVAITQGDRVCRLDGMAARPHADTWSLVGDANGIETGTEAQALGLAIQFREWDRGLAFETFTWLVTLPVKGCAPGPDGPPPKPVKRRPPS